MPKKEAKVVQSRSSAIERAAHGKPPVSLSVPDRTILNDALREGATVADELEDRVMAYGRYLLAKIFNDDTSAALDVRSKNPVWTEMIRRAGGPTLKLSRKVIDVALRMAAYDRRIADDTFRSLDSGRKERLLPLGDATRMRAAASHVTKFRLTQTDTEEYVTALLAADGRRRQVRFSGPQLMTKVKKLRTNLEMSSTLRRVGDLSKNMDAPAREKMAGEMDRLSAAVREVAKLLRSGR